jgi:hypothetical protein
MQRLRHAAVLVAAVSALFVPAQAARAQVVDPGLDHLKCYTIKDSLQPARYVADLRNQFGLEPGCLIGVPARLLCVETEKRILAPQPPGGGPSGTPAGHFLCYPVRCPTTAATGEIRVEDQFGRRSIAFQKERILCAPTNADLWRRRHRSGRAV